jgi:ElaB/YqjD/DUF883 family membrane-anchored ribosome-binding protein
MWMKKKIGAVKSRLSVVELRAELKKLLMSVECNEMAKTLASSFEGKLRKCVEKKGDLITNYKQALAQAATAVGAERAQAVMHAAARVSS